MGHSTYVLYDTMYYVGEGPHVLAFMSLVLWLFFSSCKWVEESTSTEVL